MCDQFNNPRWKNVKASTLLGLAAVDISVLAISNVGSIQSKIYINTYVTLQFVGSQWQKFILLKSILQKWPNHQTRTRSRILHSTKLVYNPKWASWGTQITSAFLKFLELCGEKRSSYKDHEIKFAHISVESMITCTSISSSLNIQYKTTSSFQGKTDSTSKEHYWSTHPIDTENCPQSHSPHINCEYSSTSEECLIDEPPRSP